MKEKLILMVAVWGLLGCTERKTLPPSVDYKTMVLQTSNQLLYSEYSAVIRGQHDVDVYPQVSGTLTSVQVNEGAQVSKGELLFVIDQAPYKAALAKEKGNVASAQAALATAKMSYESKQQLYQEEVVSDFDLQSSYNSWLTQKAALAQAEAELLNAETNLSYTEVRSPVTGMAGMVSLRVGALVNAGVSEPLITLSDNSEVQVYFSLSEKYYLNFAKRYLEAETLQQDSLAVELRLTNGAKYAYKGRIDAISGVVDSQTGSIAVRATFPNPNRLLRSGSTGNLLLPFHKMDCLVIPQEATYEIQDKVFVYRVVDGKAQSTEVKLFPINNGTEYIVESGLMRGDVIVAEGAGLVREGSVVTAKMD